MVLTGTRWTTGPCLGNVHLIDDVKADSAMGSQQARQARSEPNPNQDCGAGRSGRLFHRQQAFDILDPIARRHDGHSGQHCLAGRSDVVAAGSCHDYKIHTLVMKPTFGQPRSPRPKALNHRPQATSIGVGQNNLGREVAGKQLSSYMSPDGTNPQYSNAYSHDRPARANDVSRRFPALASHRSGVERRQSHGLARTLQRSPLRREQGRGVE